VGTSKTLGLHNKPTGCSASGAFALGSDEKKKKKKKYGDGHDGIRNGIKPAYH
jgi:hypothetical protein